MKGNIMSFPSISMRELIEAGVHFGHKTKRWNPAMAPYIYGVRNDTHIIDLGQTVPMLHRALKAARDVAAANGKVLFVGTKRQASDVIAQTARDCGQYYINQRWLGGLLTNWETVQASVRRLKKLDEQLSKGEHSVRLTKKELLGLSRQKEKLEKSLGGIKEMGGLPDIIFIIDTCKEELAVQEALKLGIPTIAIVDTNANIEGITYPIPGNDDASRAIQLYCDLITDAINDGRASAPQPVFRASREEQIAEREAAKEAKAKEKEDAKKAKSTTKKSAMAEVAKKASEDSAKDTSATDQAAKKPAKKPSKKDEAKVETLADAAAAVESADDEATKKAAS